MTALQLLSLEDSPLDAEVIHLTLTEDGIDCELLRVETRVDFVEALSTRSFDLILADYSLPGFDGMAAMEIARTFYPDIPFIFVSGSMGEELVIEALKQGATDYVLKHNLGRLVPCVQRALQEAEHKRKRREAEVAMAEGEASWRLLYDVTSGLLASVDQPATLMQNLFDQLAPQLDLDSYYYYSLEATDQDAVLQLQNYTGLTPEQAEQFQQVELGQYLCGWVAQNCQQLVLNQTEIATHPRAAGICSMGVTSYSGQPLIIREQLLGTLSFTSFRRTAFTPREIDLLGLTANQVAIALDHINLIRSIQDQAERLRQANQMKDEFLAVLSHELRSPLNPIVGWLYLLKTGDLSAERQREALNSIERNINLQSQLINDLLDIARIMQGKLTLEASLVDLAGVIAAAVETVHLAATAKQVEIILHLETTPPVMGDATRLQQVMWNLLSNAVKFTLASGRIQVELKCVDQWAQVRVADTGVGIQSSFLPHVFECFRQADSSTTRKFGGLGLGLAIVRQIVELHGGRIWAESDGENQGSTFTVQLPMQQPSLAAQPESSLSRTEPTPPFNHLQILVIDDDQDTRMLQTVLLEHNGATVLAAASASEALQMLDQFIPDVLVSDIGMTDTDGYMLIRQIRSRSAVQGGAVPAIALTAYAGDSEQQKALESGFQLHLAKPIRPDALIEAIASVLQQG